MRQNLSIIYIQIGTLNEIKSQKGYNDNISMKNHIKNKYNTNSNKQFTFQNK